jgi:hypothetical protein
MGRRLRPVGALDPLPAADPDPIAQAINATSQAPRVPITVTLLGNTERVAQLDVPVGISDAEWLGLIAGLIKARDALHQPQGPKPAIARIVLPGRSS